MPIDYRNVPSSADSVADRDLSILLNCRQRWRILQATKRCVGRGARSLCTFQEEEKRETKEERYQNGQERSLETNVSDLTLPLNLRGSVAATPSY